MQSHHPMHLIRLRYTLTHTPDAQFSGAVCFRLPQIILIRGYIILIKGTPRLAWCLAALITNLAGLAGYYLPLLIQPSLCSHCEASKQSECCLSHTQYSGVQSFEPQMGLGSLDCPNNLEIDLSSTVIHHPILSTTRTWKTRAATAQRKTDRVS